MTAGKAIRLSKVARTLNVGISTIVEFLSTKGVKVAANPNTKIAPDQHEMLLEKFQPDMLIKQKKEQALAQAEKDRAELFGKEATPAPKSEKKFIKDSAEEEVVVKSNVVSKSADKKVEAPKEEESKVEQPKTDIEKAEVPKPEKPAEKVVEKVEEKPVEPKVEAPVVKEEPKPKPIEKAEEVIDATPEVKEEKPAEPKVKEAPKVAETKIEEKPVEKAEDLKPEKPVEKVVEKVEEAPKAAEPKLEKPTPKPEEPKLEQPKPKAVEDLHKEEVEKKGGLKVLGKIEIEDKSKKKHKPSQKTKKVDSKTTEVKPEAKTKEESKPKEQQPKQQKEESQADAAAVKTEDQKPENKNPETESAEGKPRTEGEKPDGSDHKWEDKRVALKGLSVKGKVDLKQFEPKKKKPDPKQEADKKKRKRKRITASKAVSSTDDRDKLNKANRENQQRFGENRGRGGQGGPNRGSGGPGGGGPNRGSGGPGGPNRGPGGPNQNNRKRTRGRRDEKAPVDEKQIQNQIKETLNRLTNKDGKGAKTKLKKRKKEILKQRAAEQELASEASSMVLEVTEFITASELASLMDKNVNEVIMACMALGMMVSINQRIDAETITLVAEEFGYDVKFKEVEMDEPSLEEPDDESRLEERPPVVTIMGHVDHGKTSLLDFIRNTNVIGGEAGGITQHIGAYEVELKDGKKITFLDTPGHEAFTAMRARGAQVTDIVIIVVAADDRVMPQTKEAIAHAQAANVPMIFAINKVDREASNPDQIKQQLGDMNLLVEEWGGEYQSQDISAKTGLNVEELLEKVLLQAELLELKADAEKRAVGTVVEATLDRGRGIVSTVLVQGGTLRIGDNILAGAHYGKVKAMTNERGRRIKEAGPSTPVQILGFDGAPTSGDSFYSTKTEQEAKSIAVERMQLIREQGIRAHKHITLDEIGRRIAVGNFKELKVIVKGDVDGSVEALSDSLLKLTTEEIQVQVIHKAVGQISESDVLLASASDAVIIGFQVRPSQNAKMLADKEQIDIRLYSIIYDAIEELKSAMEGMLEPTTEEKVVANVEIRETFKISKVGTIAGCMVLTGKVNRNSKVRIIRDGVVRYTGEIGALKRFKDDVKEVAKGYECGIQLANYNDIAEGDIIEAYELVEVKRTLK
ncbi:MAG: translation initiation factor IF-2 [Bacteroidia bacterium]